MDLSATIHLLGDLLGQVISEQESPRIFQLEERIRQLAKERRAGEANAAGRLSEQVHDLNADQARAIAAAFSLYFDLVNLAEEKHRISALRDRTRENFPQPIVDSIGEAIAELHQKGVSRAEMQVMLSRLQIEPVLTAHPTEAKRRTILSKLRRIEDILAILDLQTLLPGEMQSYQEEIYNEITSLWLTNRARTARPAVTDEVRTGLYFVDEVFWEVLPEMYAELNAALESYYPGLRPGHTWLRLGSWMGGDRDGNPNVTAAITAETLRLHRGLAVEKHRRSLQDLARRLSLSDDLVPPPPELLAWFDSRRPLPEHVAYLEERYAHEPYRLALSLLAADLAEASRDEMTARLLSHAPHQALVHLEDILQPLRLIRDSIPDTLAEGLALTVQRQFEIFGLHSARLDLREASIRLNASLGEILRALKIEENFEGLEYQARRDLLVRLLSEPAPKLSPHPGVTSETSETWALFQLNARARQIYGSELLGPFIISMTRDAADMLVVLLFARWTGCDEGLQVVPLFETRADLQEAPRILDGLFRLPVYREHLRTCGDHQMVMVGYSDSNKDAGYLAAKWALYQAQAAIAATCKKHEIDFTLFHGQGGTVARGGGPANRAIQAQAPGTINAHFRLTEQGEVIASRYSNPNIARRHLEQIINGVLLASTPEAGKGQLQEDWRNAMDRMAEEAFRAFRELVYETDGFLEFWHSATPLEEIKLLHIGSRPASRTPGKDRVESIRAIPWVFSWMQGRFNLPGWFGLGSGLAVMGEEGLPLLQQMYAEWPFFAAVLDNAEMSLLKADMAIAALYVDLVPDQALGRRIFEIIEEEYNRTHQALLNITGHENLMDADPVIQRSIQLRNPYVDPLNYLQVDVLKRLRAMPDSESEEAQDLRNVVILTINGIASGLRNTG